MSSSNSSLKIIVAMSGGVDSSVSALLLKNQGYTVEGLFMKNWEEDDTDSYCAAEKDIADAKAVCDRIGILLHTVNFAAEYWENVFTYFLEDYAKGRTPNPDILCNREIKFKVCLDYALQRGADYFATGHYAQNQYHQGIYHLVQGKDNNKDQTYFLYTLTQATLAKTLFPIGHLPKPEVRRIAASAGLITHAKKDSTGICFVGEKRFKAFLSHYLPSKPGDIESVEGKKMGRHEGLMYYTLGQRQGLGIGGTKGNGEPWYVVNKDITRNVLIVAQGRQHPSLFSRTLTCEHVHWIAEKTPDLPLICTAKIRYRHLDQPCAVTKHDENHYTVTFTKPQWAITPGQSIVFYQQEHCLGGGVINAVL